MKRICFLTAAFVLACVLGLGAPAFAQTEREVKQKQTELKTEYNQAQETNQVIREAARDKTRATSRRARGSAVGYQYTQVQGFELKGLEERMDKVFGKADELGYLEEKYNLNGSFAVSGRRGLGSAAISRVEVYYVEATDEEQQNENVEAYDVIEVRVIKLETLPPEETTDEGDDEGGLGMMGGSSGEPVTKAYTLAGEDLWAAIRMVDEPLYLDVLTHRKTDKKIDVSPSITKDKRGPFIVQTPSDLETSTSRFRDFWNPVDTMVFSTAVLTAAAGGPIFYKNVPVVLPDNATLKVENKDTVQLRITEAKFVGENADQFRVKTSPTLLLDPVRGQNDKGNITVEYVGSSSYETKGTLRITGSGGKEQDIRVIANPGRQQTDYVVLDASLDKIELRSPRNSSFAPDWKLTYAMGTEEIGLPRWTSGMSTLSVGFKNDMSVGVVLPMNMTAGDIPSPLGYDTRLLASPMGYNVTFDFTFGFPFSLGGSLTVTNKFDGQDPYHNLKLIQVSESDITKPNYYHDFFNISTIAQLYYPIMFKDRENNPNVTFRLDLGGTFMQIQRNHVVLPGETTKEGKAFTSGDVGKMVNLTKLKDVADVYARLSFINLSARNNYGIGLGYFSGRMMADAWLELTSWLRVEAKYSFLLRDREIWENETSYFLVTPRFRLGFPSIFN